MHALRYVLAAVFLALLGSAALAAPMPVVTTADATTWMPATGMEKGTEVAVLVGDPTKSGMYIIRLKLPAGTTFPPHVHAQTENVTVISGTLWVGMGKTMDAASMKPLTAGTFATIPPNFAHYATAKDETVIQIEGMGPETMMDAK